MSSIQETNTLQKILKVLYIIVISFVCLIIGFLLFYVISSQMHSNNETYRPKFSIYTIVSPSMEPVIDVYDVVVNIRPDQNDIHVGDIITYVSAASNSEGMTITHRVVQIIKDENNNKLYLTQGDNNSNPDSLFVSYDQIIGKKVFIIPKLGKLQFLIADKKSWLYILLIPIFFFILKDLYKIIDLLILKKKVEEVTTEDEEEIHKTKQIQLKEELKTKHDLELPKLKQDKVIKPTIEVLDTDELTSKIKEYDEKINELNKLIEEMNPPVETFIEQDDYLQGYRIKVIKIEDTKNKKIKIEDKPISKPKPEAKQNSKPQQKKKNNQGRKLNLNPNKPNKINRKRKRTNQRLNLNPKNIKQINRPGKRKQNAEQAFQRKRKFVEIKKVK